MMTSPNILTCCQTDSIKLKCEIDLNLLFDTGKEREKFEKKWDEKTKGSPIKGLVKRKNTPSLKKIHFLIDS